MTKNLIAASTALIAAAAAESYGGSTRFASGPLFEGPEGRDEHMLSAFRQIVQEQVNQPLADLGTRMTAVETRANAVPAVVPAVVPPADPEPTREVQTPAATTRTVEETDAARRSILSAAGSSGAVDPNGQRAPIRSLDPTRIKPLGQMDGDEDMIQVVGNTIRALAIAKKEGGGLATAEQYARTFYKDERAARHIRSSFERAMNGGDAQAGGALVPTEFIPRLIDLLYAKEILVQAGVQIIPMSSGKATLPKLLSGGAAFWVGENQAIPESSLKFGWVELVAKDLGALIPIGNDLLRDSSYRANEITVRNLTKVMALEADRVGLYGQGGKQPQGLLTTPGLTRTNATTGAKAMNNDLSGLEGRYYAANPDDDKRAWLMHPIMDAFLRNVTNSQGQFVFRSEMDAGRFQGAPHYMSTQVRPNTLVFGDFSALWRGETQSVTIDTSSEASYTDSNGVSVSAFQNNLTLVRAIERLDYAVAHAEVFQILENIPLDGTWQWTAS
jgi:HK97 family phage major capsid protein